MTNRDYLRSLSDEKLAELLNEFRVFAFMVCEDGNCRECITNWLKAEREPKKEIDET